MTFLAPIGKATAAEVAAYQREQCNFKELPERWSLQREWELNRLYVLENMQWLEEAANFAMTTDGYRMNPFLQRAQVQNAYQAMPTQNEMIAITQNEVARLIAGKTDFVVHRTDRSTAIDRAARIAERVLRADNIARNWRGMETTFARDMTIFGTGLIRTGQDMDFYNTMSQPMDVTACEKCQWLAVTDKLQTVKGMPVLGGREAMRMVMKFGGKPYNFRTPAYDADGEDLRVEMNEGTDESEPQAYLDMCPECGGTLREREAGADEEKDFDDNPTSRKVPSYDAGMGIVSPYDWYPAGNGRLDPDGKIRLWTTERIVSLDWIAQHYRDGYKVDPGASEDDLATIATYHPAGNEDGSFCNLKGDTGRRLEGYCVIRETVRLPYWDLLKPNASADERHLFDRGRWMVTAGDRLLIDSELMMEDERSGELVPRVEMNWSCWEPRKDSCWGKPHASYLRSIQDSINMALAQAMEMRHLHGNPKILLPNGTQLDYAGQAFGGWQNTVWRYIGEKPERMEGMALNESWKFELTQDVEAIQRVGSSRAVESGGAPGAGITAFSALQLLSDNSAITRQPRIDGKKQCVARVHRHRLQLMGVLYTDERQFRAGDRGDHQAFEAFRGQDLCGQFDVEILASPFVETPLLRREAAKEGLGAGTLILRTAGDRARYNEAIGVPTDIAPGDGIQIDRAKREWLALVQRRDTPDGNVARYSLEHAPVVKWRIDDDLVHVEQHVEDINSWEGEEMRTNWDALEALLAGWEDQYNALEAADMAGKMNPEGDRPRSSLLVPGPDGQISSDAVKSAGESWMQGKRLQATVEAQPKLPELRIFGLWLNMLQQQGYHQAGPDDADVSFAARVLSPADLALLRMLAHNEAHYRNHEKKQMAAAPPAPGQADPEAPKPGAPSPAGRPGMPPQPQA